MLPKYKHAIDQLKSMNPNMILNFFEMHTNLFNLQEVGFIRIFKN